MSQIVIGQRMIFRNGEAVVVANILQNRVPYVTCNTAMQSQLVEVGNTFVVAFDDGELTIAAANELTELGVTNG